MKENIIDMHIKNYKNNAKGDLFKFAKNKIKNEGQRIQLDGEEVYYSKITFNTDEAFPPEGVEDGLALLDIDSNQLSDNELISLFYWAVLQPDVIYDIGAARVKTY